MGQAFRLGLANTFGVGVGTVNTATTVVLDPGAEGGQDCGVSIDFSIRPLSMLDQTKIKAQFNDAATTEELGLNLLRALAQVPTQPETKPSRTPGAISGSFGWNDGVQEGEDGSSKPLFVTTATNVKWALVKGVQVSGVTATATFSVAVSQWADFAQEPFLQKQMKKVIALSLYIDETFISLNDRASTNANSTTLNSKGSGFTLVKVVFTMAVTTQFMYNDVKTKLGNPNFANLLNNNLNLLMSMLSLSNTNTYNAQNAKANVTNYNPIVNRIYTPISHEFSFALSVSLGENNEDLTPLLVANPRLKEFCKDIMEFLFSAIPNVQTRLLVGNLTMTPTNVATLASTLAIQYQVNEPIIVTDQKTEDQINAEKAVDRANMHTILKAVHEDPTVRIRAATMLNDKLSTLGHLDPVNMPDQTDTSKADEVGLPTNANLTHTVMVAINLTSLAGDPRHDSQFSDVLHEAFSEWLVVPLHRIKVEISNMAGTYPGAVILSIDLNILPDSAAERAEILSRSKDANAGTTLVRLIESKLAKKGLLHSKYTPDTPKKDDDDELNNNPRNTAIKDKKKISITNEVSFDLTINDADLAGISPTPSEAFKRAIRGAFKNSLSLDTLEAITIMSVSESGARPNARIKVSYEITYGSIQEEQETLAEAKKKMNHEKFLAEITNGLGVNGFDTSVVFAPTSRFELDINPMGFGMKKDGMITMRLTFGLQISVPTSDGPLIDNAPFAVAVKKAVALALNRPENQVFFITVEETQLPRPNIVAMITYELGPRSPYQQWLARERSKQPEASQVLIAEFQRLFNAPGDSETIGGESNCTINNHGSNPEDPDDTSSNQPTNFEMKNPGTLSSDIHFTTVLQSTEIDPPITFEPFMLAIQKSLAVALGVAQQDISITSKTQIQTTSALHYRVSCKYDIAIIPNTEQQKNFVISMSRNLLNKEQFIAKMNQFLYPLYNPSRYVIADYDPTGFQPQGLGIPELGLTGMTSTTELDVTAPVNLYRPVDQQEGFKFAVERGLADAMAIANYNRVVVTNLAGVGTTPGTTRVAIDYTLYYIRDTEKDSFVRLSKLALTEKTLIKQANEYLVKLKLSPNMMTIDKWNPNKPNPGKLSVVPPKTRSLSSSFKFGISLNTTGTDPTTDPTKLQMMATAVEQALASAFSTTPLTEPLNGTSLVVGADNVVVTDIVSSGTSPEVQFTVLYTVTFTDDHSRAALEQLAVAEAFKVALLNAIELYFKNADLVGGDTEDSSGFSVDPFKTNPSDPHDTETNNPAATEITPPSTTEGEMQYTLALQSSTQTITASELASSALLKNVTNDALIATLNGEIPGLNYESGDLTVHRLLVTGSQPNFRTTVKFSFKADNDQTEGRLVTTMNSPSFKMAIVEMIKSILEEVGFLTEFDPDVPPPDDDLRQPSVKMQRSGKVTMDNALALDVVMKDMNHGVKPQDHVDVKTAVVESVATMLGGVTPSSRVTLNTLSGGGSPPDITLRISYQVECEDAAEKTLIENAASAVGSQGAFRTKFNAELVRLSLTHLYELKTPDDYRPNPKPPNFVMPGSMQGSFSVGMTVYPSAPSPVQHPQMINTVKAALAFAFTLPVSGVTIAAGGLTLTGTRPEVTLNVDYSIQPRSADERSEIVTKSSDGDTADAFMAKFAELLALLPTVPKVFDKKARGAISDLPIKIYGETMPSLSDKGFTNTTQRALAKGLGMDPLKDSDMSQFEIISVDTTLLAQQRRRLLQAPRRALLEDSSGFKNASLSFEFLWCCPLTYAHWIDMLARIEAAFGPGGPGLSHLTQQLSRYNEIKAGLTVDGKVDFIITVPEGVDPDAKTYMNDTLFMDKMKDSIMDRLGLPLPGDGDDDGSEDDDPPDIEPPPKETEVTITNITFVPVYKTVFHTSLFTPNDSNASARNITTTSKVPTDDYHVIVDYTVETPSSESKEKMKNEVNKTVVDKDGDGIDDTKKETEEYSISFFFLFRFFFLFWFFSLLGKRLINISLLLYFLNNLAQV